MSTTKHTPGPWWPTDSGIRDQGGYIAHTNSVQRYEGQDERYAREVAQREADKLLIAAAPELLEALKVAEQFLEIASDWNLHEAEINGEMRSTYDWLDVIRAAIAKATGTQHA